MKQFIDKLVEWFENNRDTVMTSGARLLAVVCLFIAVVYAVIFYRQLTG